MGVRERMMVLRLMEKLRDKTEYAHRLGLEIQDDQERKLAPSKEQENV